MTHYVRPLVGAMPKCQTNNFLGLLFVTQDRRNEQEKQTIP